MVFWGPNVHMEYRMPDMNARTLTRDMLQGKDEMTQQMLPVFK